MAFDTAFLDLMPLSVTVEFAEQPLRYDHYGKSILSGTTKVYRARTELGTTRLVTNEGQVITSTKRLILACQDELSAEDKIILPANLIKYGKPIKAPDLVWDEEVPHHTEIHF